MDQIPMSPTLLKKLPLDDSFKQAWLAQRENLIKQKNNIDVRDSRLREYQNQGVNFFSKIKNRGNFDQQRLGKTPTVLVSMRENNENNAIIVVPKIVLLQWEQEYKKWHGGECIAVAADLYNKKKRAEIYKDFKGTIIINKQLLNIDIDLIEKRKIDTMVVDEVHHLYTYKGAVGKRTTKIVDGVEVIEHKRNTVQNIIYLSRKVTSRYALSGTVSPKTPHMIYGILAFLFPTLFKSYWGFIEYYFDVTMERVSYQKEVRVIGDWKSEDRKNELLEFIETISVQRKRENYMLWLDEANVNYVWLPMNQKLKEQYDNLHEFYELDNKDIVILNDLTRLIREEQLISDPRLLDLDIEAPKTEWFRQFLKDYPEDSILVVSPYTSYMKLLHEETPKSMLISGETPVRKREEIKNKFNTQPKQILFANIDTIMEGISLYGADSLIVMNRNWVPGKNEQVFDRILATTPEQAADMGEQNIYIVQVEAHIDQYKHEVLKTRQSLNTVVNNYPEWISKERRKKE